MKPKKPIKSANKIKYTSVGADALAARGFSPSSGFWANFIKRNWGRKPLVIKNPLAAPVLLGLGLDEFSMTAKAVPLIKQVIRRFSVTEARNIAERALALGDATEVRAYLASVAR